MDSFSPFFILPSAQFFPAQFFKGELKILKDHQKGAC